MSFRETIVSSADNRIVGLSAATHTKSSAERARPAVVHVITELGSGGAERMLARLVTASKQYRHVVISLATEGELGTALRSAGIEVIALHMRRSFPSPRTVCRLAKIIRHVRPAIVQTWLYHADLIGLVAVRLANVPCIVAWNLRCSNLDLARYRWTTQVVVKLLSWLSTKPDIVMANSEAGRRWHHIIGYRPKRWETVPNGIDTTAFHPDPAARARWRQRLRVKDDEVLIGMVARRDPTKDHEGMLQAAAEAARRQPDLVFVLAGRDVSQKDPILARLADRVGAQVHLIDEISDVPGLNAALDIGVLASASEGFPNVVAEAMAVGVPCIVTNVGDSATIVGDTGIVVPPGDSRTLAEAISTLASNVSLRARMGEAARRRIEERYGLAATVARYEAVWAERARSSSTL